jgi:hypothetical protein
MVTVTVPGALVLGNPSEAVKVNVTEPTPDPLSVKVAEHGVGVLVMVTVSRGRLGVPAAHDVTG